jgi:D-lactate dehydrogenase (cytochrome)
MRAVPTLFLEFHGSEAGVAEQAETVQAIAAEHGGSGFAWARDAEARNRLWKARHDAYWAGIAWRPGKKGITTDVCVPISRLAEALLGAKEDIAASGFEAPIVGHVGDGNFHTIILVNEDDPAEMERAWALDRAIVARALSLGGTCSGEPGARARAGRARAHAHAEAGDGPARHPEPRQDLPELTRMALAAA